MIEGDEIITSMSFNNKTQMWTVTALNTRNHQDSTLRITKKAAANATYDYALFVFENILTPNACNQLPSSGGITFTNISVDGVWRLDLIRQKYTLVELIVI